MKRRDVVDRHDYHGYVASTWKRKLWNMRCLSREFVLIWRDWLGKKTRRTYWSTWNGGDGGLEYETVVVWLVVDGWLLWEWDETLGNWGTCVGEYARHKKSSNRTETLSSSYLRGWQFLRCAHIPVYVDNPETSYRLPSLPQLPPLVSRIQSCIISQQIVEEMIRNECGGSWCIMNKEVIDADYERLFWKSFRIACLGVWILSRFELLEKGEMDGWKSWREGIWLVILCSAC